MKPWLHPLLLVAIIGCGGETKDTDTALPTTPTGTTSTGTTSTGTTPTGTTPTGTTPTGTTPTGTTPTGTTDTDTGTQPTDTGTPPTTPTGTTPTGTTPTGTTPTGTTPTDTGTIPTTPTGTTPTDTSDTGGPVPAALQGSLVLVHRAASMSWPTEHTQLRGLFGSDLQGYLNAAECAPIFNYFCVSELPVVEDTYVDVPNVFDAAAAGLVSAGNVSAIGPYAAQRINLAGFGLYYDSGELGAPPFQAATDLGVSLVGDVFPAYAGVADIRTPSRLGIVSPSPSVSHTWVAGDVVNFTWTPGLEGDVHLAVATLGEGFLPESRVYLLEDDGSFDLALDDLGFEDGDLPVFVLGRWTVDSVDVAGNPVDVVAKSEAWISGSWVDPEGAVQLDAEDTCGAAVVAPELGAGVYVGSIDAYAANMDPTCLPGPGPEGFYRVVLDPGERITVTYDLYGDDGAVYLLDDCNAAGSCVEGADVGGTDAAETLEYLNAGAAAMELFLTVDAFTASLSGDGIYTLDVAFDFPALVPVGETCADAQAAVPLEPGTYLGDLAGGANNLAPPVDTCAGSAGSAGPDEFFKVSVPPGELLTVRTDTTHHYLMEDCLDPLTCENVSSALAPFADFETLYLNTDIVAKDLYVVVDSASAFAAGPFELTVETEPVDSLAGADDCATAAAAGSLGAGSWWVTVGDDADDLDPNGAAACGSVDGSGADEMHRITVADGEVAFVSVDGGVSAYLVTDCLLATSCLDGSIGGGTMAYANTSGAPVDIFVVLDHGPDQAARVARLEVWFETALPAVDADDCAGAAGLPDLTTGLWAGDTTGYVNNLNPGAGGCTGTVVNGPDAMMPVHLEPGDLLTVDDLGSEESVYLVTDCLLANSCQAASPVETDTTGTQGLVYVNETAANQDLYLIVDNADPLGGGYLVDVDLRPTEVLMAADDCADAATVAPLTTGAYGYTGDLTPYANDYDLGLSPGSCTGFATSGQDAVVPVELLPGERLEAQYTFDMPFGDSAMYVLEVCGDLGTCAVGSDNFGVDNATERVTYTNDTGATQLVYLVLDGFTDSGPFVARIDVF